MKKRTKKPGDFRVHGVLLAWCLEDCDGTREVYYGPGLSSFLTGANATQNIRNAERFAAWIVRTAPWCREAKR